jgi:TonB family protein
MKNSSTKILVAVLLALVITAAAVAQKNKAKGLPDPQNHNLIIKDQSPPELTSKARHRGIHGTIRLKVEFLATGKIGDIVVVYEDPANSWTAVDMVESAIKATKKIKFEPAVKDGVAVTVYKLTEFRLDVP